MKKYFTYLSFDFLGGSSNEFNHSSAFELLLEEIFDVVFITSNSFSQLLFDGSILKFGKFQKLFFMSPIIPEINSFKTDGEKWS